MDHSVLDTIGSPLVQVASPAGATVAAKLESKNPGGSAKDRPALAMVEAAEDAGVLEPGDRLVEPTSGNTGVGLAMVAAAKGYDATIVMSESVSTERRGLMRAYGAGLEIVEGGISAAQERADELEAEGLVQLRQFEHAANPRAHYETTGPEILDEVGERTIEGFVAGVGTGGTITGTARRLREAFPDVEVVAVEPEDNPVLSTGESGEDEFQGMGPGFVSDNLDTDLLDGVETVGLDDAEAECRRLAREEGILVGQSSGAASLAARRVADRLAAPELDCPPAPVERPGDLAEHSGDAAEHGGEREGGDPGDLTADGGYDDCPLVVTVFPDTGERYLSTGLFD